MENYRYSHNLNMNIVVNYKDNDCLRHSFNELTQATFGFDFEAWYQNGYWQDKYIPYSIVDDNKVIANISVNPMEFERNGRKKHYIQLGTVMTEKAYRNQGLSRFLMERILEEWKSKTDGFYLFANDSVLDFYPKFGFKKCDEYQYSCEINKMKQQTASLVANYDSTDITLLGIPKKIDMSQNENRKQLIHAIENSISNSKFTMKNNPGLLMFYTTSFMKESVYYLKYIDTYVITDIEDKNLILNDIYSKNRIEVEEIIRAFIPFGIERVIFNFTPKDCSCYDVSKLQEDNTSLFILGDDLIELETEKLMFPTLSHA